MHSKEELDHLRMARYCDMAERYDDMAKEMKAVMEICHREGLEITTAYRNLLSLAYKNVVSARRSSWRILYTERQKQEEKAGDDLRMLDELLGRVERELFAVCDEVIELIDRWALGKCLGTKKVEDGCSSMSECSHAQMDSPTLRSFSSSYSPHHLVFFLKMKGDYWRYKAEALQGEAEAAKAANANYSDAKKLADSLVPTDPIRLGLYLNYSVFNFEILSNTEAACEIARSAFSCAIAELDNLSEEHYKDSTLIMQLLRDNLNLWSSKTDDDINKNDDNIE